MTASIYKPNTVRWDRLVLGAPGQQGQNSDAKFQWKMRSGTEKCEVAKCWLLAFPHIYRQEILCTTMSTHTQTNTHTHTYTQILQPLVLYLQLPVNCSSPTLSSWLCQTKKRPVDMPRLTLPNLSLWPQLSLSTQSLEGPPLSVPQEDVNI